MRNIETNRYDAFPGATVAMFLFSLIYLPSVDCNECTNRITLLMYACMVAVIVVRCLELAKLIMLPLSISSTVA